MDKLLFPAISGLVEDLARYRIIVEKSLVLPVLGQIATEFCVVVIREALTHQRKERGITVLGVENVRKALEWWVPARILQGMSTQAGSVQQLLRWEMLINQVVQDLDPNARIELSACRLLVVAVEWWVKEYLVRAAGRVVPHTGWYLLTDRDLPLSSFGF